MVVVSGRNEHIDLLRGVAILCVLVLHFSLAYGIRDSPLGLLFPAWLVRAVVFNGNYGVTAFFAISGFLITSHSIRRWGRLEQIKLREFYLFRMARIMPPLLLVLAIIVVLGCSGLPYFSNTDNHQHLPSSYFVIAVGSVLTFWHNELMQSVGYFNYCLNIFWSLSVEEVFYLGMPVLALCLRKTWLLAIVCLALIAWGPVYRGAHADNEIYFMYAFPACFDAIAMGCLAALVAARVVVPCRLAAFLRAGCGVVLAMTYLVGIDGHEDWGFSLVAVAAAGYLVSAAHAPSLRPIVAALLQPVCSLGRHSYELYLFHIVVLGLLRNVAAKGDLSKGTLCFWMILFFGLSIGVALLVARFVSDPANKAIRQHYSARSVVQPESLAEG